jgi:hypothetical protein
MLQLQLLVIQAWFNVKEGFNEWVEPIDWDNDRGVTSETIILAILAVTAITVGGIIAAKVIGHANKIPN